MTEPLNRKGLAYAAGAFGFWGLFPLFMDQLRPAGALEIVAHRALWSLAWCLLFIALARQWKPLFAALRNRRAVATLALASGFLAVNWGIFTFSVLSNRVSDSSLGYYINPLITVALGVILLGERLHRAQKVAIGLACVAVAVVGIDAGGIPWIAPALAVTFATYTLIKKRVGLSIDALTGMTIETIALAPLAALLVWFLAATGRTTWGDNGLGHDLWLASAGLWTAGALIVFAAGTARVPLYVTGFMQYLTPTGSFILAVTYFGETMSGLRWAGFGLVWVALVIVSIDSWRRSRTAAELRVRAAKMPEEV